MPDLAYVNGRVTALRDAVIPIQDRGFLLSDGVYEVLRSYAGRIFALEAHLERLDASLWGLRLRAPVGRRRLVAILEDLRRRSGYPDARLYVQVTRGVAARQHAFPRRARPTLVVYVQRTRSDLAAARRRGVAAITLPDPRWRRCDLKTIALLPNVLAKQEAVDAGAHEAFFLGPGGVVREGASANVFLVRGRTLSTHPLGAAILPGVSRAVVLELAREMGLRVLEKPFRRADLLRADEVFISSTMQEVLPVVRIDGCRIGTGRPGRVALELWRCFHARTHGEPAASERTARAATKGRTWRRRS